MDTLGGGILKGVSGDLMLDRLTFHSGNFRVRVSGTTMIAREHFPAAAHTHPSALPPAYYRSVVYSNARLCVPFPASDVLPHKLVPMPQGCAASLRWFSNRKRNSRLHHHSTEDFCPAASSHQLPG